jgi:hypothetical protein
LPKLSVPESPCTVPALLNTTATLVVATPTLFWIVPALLITPPNASLKVHATSFWMSNSPPTALLKFPPPFTQNIPVPVQVPLPVLLSVRVRSLTAVPDSDSPPAAIVVPAPCIVPLLQLVSPLTVSVLVPPSTPPVCVRLVALAVASGSLIVMVPAEMLSTPTEPTLPVNVGTPPFTVVVPPTV